MPKRKETLELENALYEMCKDKRIYGCEEVTIGFPHQRPGKRNEICDFVTMDSKGIIRCYEIKVTLQDLKSKAKKSWYGHYNYLVITPELEKKLVHDGVINYTPYIDEGVGIIVGKSLHVEFSARKQELSKETESMLKESIIRSMFYKMAKYKDACDMETINELNGTIRYWEKTAKNKEEEITQLKHLIHRFRHAHRVLTGRWEEFENIVEEECRKAADTGVFIR